MNDIVSAPDVDMADDGSFVVVWQESVNNDNNVRYAVYNVSDESIPTVTPRSTGAVAATAAAETNPEVAADRSGNFVVSFTSAGSTVVARRYSNSGSPLGSPVTVALNATPGSRSHIDRSDGGRFAISYLMPDPAPSANGADFVMLARYDKNGVLLGSKLKVGRVTGDAIASHDVALDNAGNSVVVFDTGLSSGDENIFMARVSASGSILQAAKRIVGNGDFEAQPRIAMDRSDGDFVVSYQVDRGATSELFVGEFNRNGTPKAGIGGAIHNLQTSARSAGAICLDSLDRYFVAYDSIGLNDDTDIFGRFGNLL